MTRLIATPLHKLMRQFYLNWFLHKKNDYSADRDSEQRVDNLSPALLLMLKMQMTWFLEFTVENNLMASNLTH